MPGNDDQEELLRQRALFALELEKFLANPRIPPDIKEMVAGQNYLDYSSISLRDLALELHEAGEREG